MSDRELRDLDPRRRRARKLTLAAPLVFMGTPAWLAFAVVLATCRSLEAQQPSADGSILSDIGSQGWRAVELTYQREDAPGLRETLLYQGLWLRDPAAPDSTIFDFLPFASAPRDRNGMALAYDQGIGPRMWSGFVASDPAGSALLGATAQVALTFWRRLSGLDGGPRDLVRPSRCPHPRLRLGDEAPVGFGTDGRDAPADARALLVYADCGRDLGSAWQVSAGLRGYAWRNPGGADRQDLEASVRLAHLPPREGTLVFLDGSWTPRYQRFVLHVERPLEVSGIRLRPLARLAWGEGLPFALGFWPGGYDGFPGLKAVNHRGDHEITAALDAQRPIVGPLSLRGMIATGRTSEGGPLVGGPWLVGIRGGLNLDTRLGLVRLEYGVATRHHHAFFIRLGRLL
jgi:hypothetical protein